MWHILWIPVLVPTLIIRSNCDNNRTHSDVYIQYSGHAEADEADLPETIPYTTKKTTTTAAPTTKTSTTVNITVLSVTTPNTTIVTTPKTPAPTTETTTTTTTTIKPVTTTTVEMSEEQTDAVIFLPDVRTGRRDDGYIDGMHIKDLLMKPLPEVMNNKFHEEKLLDAQKDAVVFVAGKNGEIDTDKKQDTNANYNSNQVDDYEDPNTKVPPIPRLNCSNLDCNNIIHSICGGKIVNREWKYRLFLNDCYFRKVNCGYKYKVNRYIRLPLDKCKTTGTHQVERPFSFTPKIYNFDKVETKPESLIRKGYASRRSMTMTAKGEFCSHPCPAACPDNYDPECAISATGQKRVFMNHCKLDENSCFYSVVWHRSPLSVCVGGDKANIHQSRSFISWMQRVGILDAKGHLVLE
ncbi:unnamed protein product [Spodoptera littoralis]|uniref:Uncharacterized protein n=1 Tax=Spodoptera littoralis TaxID=7109 RepID=A0A9P0I725_SPOLI|nr:unnamed protein product [Spodoptera littoralis]CAH1642682.1 unnamed protein product [Spodoptera littoralis]